GPRLRRLRGGSHDLVGPAEAVDRRRGGPRAGRAGDRRPLHADGGRVRVGGHARRARVTAAHLDRLYDAYVFDLDGTIYRGRQLLPGARRAVARLREDGRAVRFRRTTRRATA